MRLTAVFTIAFSVGAWADSTVTGAGATSPQPVLEAWIREVSRQQHLRVEYQSVGSSEGIKRITARSVDFAVTDLPLTQSELSHDDLLQLPLVASGVVPVMNVPGIGANRIRLDGAVLAGIFLGGVAVWDDERIQVLNPDVPLPHLPIAVVHRLDGSGSTFTFTSYLAKESPVWDQNLGIGSRVAWPVGLGVKGNEGVAARVAEVSGSIGYVEYLYARQNRLTTIIVRNRAGRYVEPSVESFEAAFTQARWDRPSFYEMLTDLPGTGSWPIVAVSYVLLHRTQLDPGDARQTLQFLNWVYAAGEPIASQNAYLLVNREPLISRVRAAWTLLKDGHGDPLVR
jgi:phosphate transport system substrate-binding protein